MTRLNGGNKYHAKRTWSELCQRWFDSKAESIYGEGLFLMQKAGEIEDLRFQVPVELADNVKIILDFTYRNKGYEPVIWEDVKGKMTEACRIKLAWLKQRWGIEVKIIKKGE